MRYYIIILVIITSFCSKSNSTRIQLDSIFDELVASTYLGSQLNMGDFTKTTIIFLAKASECDICINELWDWNNALVKTDKDALFVIFHENEALLRRIIRTTDFPKATFFLKSVTFEQEYNLSDCMIIYWNENNTVENHACSIRRISSTDEKIKTIQTITNK